MLPTEPLVVHEDESEFECGRQEITGPVSWVTLLSADRTPTSEIVLGVAEIEPGESGEFRQHSHKHAEVYYILSGSGDVIISNKNYSIRAGTTVFFPRILNKRIGIINEAEKRSYTMSNDLRSLKR
jgi:mannose-6-phosphate isomerase-like protein (cupin superfamily)